MGQGFFFSAREIRSNRNPDGKIRTCVSCGLYKQVLTPRMEPYGNFKKGILNIGEAPGQTEDERGKQWQGKIGQALKWAYRQAGIDLFEDCININAINCRPTDGKGANRPPDDIEVACCRSRVMDVIERYKPKIIVLHGGSALESIIGHRWTDELRGIHKWRGFTIPDREFNAWICPVLHGSGVEREKEKNKAYETIWLQDLARVAGLVGKPLPRFEDETKMVEIVDDIEFLKDLRSPFAFDFETTGLKPHGKNHRIICMSVCDRPDKAWAFMMREPKDAWDPYHKQIRDALQGPGWKIAQNMKFEHTWTYNKLGWYDIRNWLWDPMQAAHILDNRPDITNLKFQTYVNYGVLDFKDDTDSYMKAIDKKNGNSLNRNEQLASTPEGRRKLLIRCGQDSLFEYRLAMDQMEQLGYDYTKPFASIF